MGLNKAMFMACVFWVGALRAAHPDVVEPTTSELGNDQLDPLRDQPVEPLPKPKPGRFDTLMNSLGLGSRTLPRATSTTSLTPPVSPLPDGGLEPGSGPTLSVAQQTKGNVDALVDGVPAVTVGGSGARIAGSVKPSSGLSVKEIPAVIEARIHALNALEQKPLKTVGDLYTALIVGKADLEAFKEYASINNFEIKQSLATYAAKLTTFIDLTDRNIQQLSVNKASSFVEELEGIQKAAAGDVFTELSGRITDVVTKIKEPQEFITSTRKAFIDLGYASDSSTARLFNRLMDPYANGKVMASEGVEAQKEAIRQFLLLCKWLNKFSFTDPSNKTQTNIIDALRASLEASISDLATGEHVDLQKVTGLREYLRKMHTVNSIFKELKKNVSGIVGELKSTQVQWFADVQEKFVKNLRTDVLSSQLNDSDIQNMYGFDVNGISPTGEIFKLQSVAQDLLKVQEIKKGFSGLDPSVLELLSRIEDQIGTDIKGEEVISTTLLENLKASVDKMESVLTVGKNLQEIMEKAQSLEKDSPESLLFKEVQDVLIQQLQKEGLDATAIKNIGDAAKTKMDDVIDIANKIQEMNKAFDALGANSLSAVALKDMYMASLKEIQSSLKSESSKWLEQVSSLQSKITQITIAFEVLKSIKKLSMELGEPSSKVEEIEFQLPTVLLRWDVRVPKDGKNTTGQNFFKRLSEREAVLQKESKTTLLAPRTNTDPLPSGTTILHTPTDTEQVDNPDNWFRNGFLDLISKIGSKEGSFYKWCQGKKKKITRMVQGEPQRLTLAEFGDVFTSDAQKVQILARTLDQNKLTKLRQILASAKVGTVDIKSTLDTLFTTQAKLSAFQTDLKTARALLADNHSVLLQEDGTEFKDELDKVTPLLDEVKEVIKLLNGDKEQKLMFIQQLSEMQTQLTENNTAMKKFMDAQELYTNPSESSPFYVSYTGENVLLGAEDSGALDGDFASFKEQLGKEKPPTGIVKQLADITATLKKPLVKADADLLKNYTDLKTGVEAYQKKLEQAARYVMKLQNLEMDSIGELQKMIQDNSRGDDVFESYIKIQDALLDLQQKAKERQQELDQKFPLTDENLVKLFAQRTQMVTVFATKLVDAIPGKWKLLDIQRQVGEIQRLLSGSPAPTKEELQKNRRLLLMFGEVLGSKLVPDFPKGMTKTLSDMVTQLLATSKTQLQGFFQVRKQPVVE